MESRIRAVRRAKGLSLEQVASRCLPPSTPQTIGRLETGARTLSIRWLNRIAQALEVEASELVSLEDRADVPIIAILDQDGIRSPGRPQVVAPHRARPGSIALKVATGVADYRSGDELWLERLDPDAFGRALNRDILVPRPGERFVFGRLIGREADRLHIIDLKNGGRQLVISNPAWIAMAVTLIRKL